MNQLPEAATRLITSKNRWIKEVLASQIDEKRQKSNRRRHSDVFSFLEKCQYAYHKFNCTQYYAYSHCILSEDISEIDIKIERHLFPKPLKCPTFAQRRQNKDCSDKPSYNIAYKLFCFISNHITKILVCYPHIQRFSHPCLSCNPSDKGVNLLGL